MYYLRANIFPNFVFTLPSSMHTYICEAPCVQVDPKPERASVDFGFKIIFLIFGGRPPFEFLYVRACARARTCFLVIRRIHALYIHARIYIYIYIYIYIHVYMHTHTYTHKTHMDECMHHDDACTDL